MVVNNEHNNNNDKSTIGLRDQTIWEGVGAVDLF